MFAVRSIAGVVLGVLAAVLLIRASQLAALAVHPPAPGADLKNDPAAVKAHIDSAPPIALGLVLIGYTLGVFAGSWVAAEVAGWAPYAHAGLIAAFFLLASIMNLGSFDHPTWFAVINLSMIPPLALLAAWL